MDSNGRVHLIVGAAQTSATPGQRKAPRKSRSKGLRCKTGCITCRKRHKKCDEQNPRCGSCVLSDRVCVWPSPASQGIAESKPLTRPNPPIDQSIVSQRNAVPQQETPIHHELAFSDQDQDNLNSQINAISPANTVTSDQFLPDVASSRWLNLLAADAVHANKGFSRGASRATSPTATSRAALPETPRSRGVPLPSAIRKAVEDESARLNGIEARSWQLDQDIVLKDFEIPIFKNFVDHASLWLDISDPARFFSVYTARLAIRNIGLMKAILALSAQHLSRQNIAGDANMGLDRNLAIEYYYETLHYVQTALQFQSYARSEYILATAIVISTYEMLDESDSGWQRHLKGVFWIQRSQNVNGASGGIRQAIWWAWLRQDIWAAFRERRRCLSIWKPVKDYPELNSYELADQGTYLLSQAVNYCAEPGDLTGLALQRRIDAADELLARLDRWKSFLNTEFTPLPTPRAQPGLIVQPIWIHPPKFGVALQTYHFARILIMLHRPAMPGFKSYQKIQKTLSEAVAVICGIATELTDEGCQIVSAQCLYGAGLCVQELQQRNEIISLINLCEARTGWPMLTLRENLYKEWQKIDSDEDGVAGILP
ncbi:hypothetical protein B0O99DRAFT_619983 [Bisporella sp. PMI_857]|nr:hypothetical protein B0O99DRAFT_619983 [Bisporella sp. PMI_857]